MAEGDLGVEEGKWILLAKILGGGRMISAPGKYLCSHSLCLNVVVQSPKLSLCPGLVYT